MIAIAPKYGLLTAHFPPSTGSGVAGSGGRLCSDSLVQGLVVTNSSVKERILEAVQKLPADATFEDVMERLVFLSKIDRGIAEADQGRTLSHEEVKARLAS